MKSILLLSLLMLGAAGARPVFGQDGESRTRGRARAEATRPPRFPHRIWAACDFETRRYAWFGPVDTSNVPRYAGNRTVLSAESGPYKKWAARMTGMNPVPGPRMGVENSMYCRYYLKGGTQATFQHFSLSSNDNNHIRVSGLREGTWSELTLNFSRDGRRNDGTRGVPFRKGERMDDLKVFLGKPDDGRVWEILLDDIIFFSNDPSYPPEPEPFPNRVMFLASFDTGITPKVRDKYWRGTFDLVWKGVPEDTWWGCAKAVAREKGRGKWIRLQVDPPTPVGARTKLRFRYHVSGASRMTVQLFDVAVQDNRHIRMKDLVQNRWTTVYLDFTGHSRRNDGSEGTFAPGNPVDDIFFFIEPEGDGEADLLIDEVVLFDAGAARDGDR